MCFSGFKNAHYIGGHRDYWDMLFRVFNLAKCISSRHEHPCRYKYTAWDCYTAENAPEEAVPMPSFCQNSFQWERYHWRRALSPWCEFEIENACFHESMVTDKFAYLQSNMGELKLEYRSE